MYTTAYQNLRVHRPHRLCSSEIHYLATRLDDDDSADVLLLKLGWIYYCSGMPFDWNLLASYVG